MPFKICDCWNVVATYCSCLQNSYHKAEEGLDFYPNWMVG